MRFSIALSDVSTEHAACSAFSFRHRPQMSPPVAAQLTMLTTLKHPIKLFDISSGMCSLILGATGHYQAAQTGLLLQMSATWSLAVI